ncbi:VOC family protein [Luteimonas panaciterrae]|uniref:VOC family protein n=1 Tax=Luteimonas panaciterrae TaxID=363885 RepID=UPI001CFA8029|nr:VOC family protein [Luteimonas panaciterrae]
MAIAQRITPFLWFDDQAEEAVAYYLETFDNSRIVSTTRYTKDGAQATGRPEGSVMTIAFELDGQSFTAINGGPHFKFNEAVSFVVNCESQEEIDRYWNRLTAGGDERSQQCGWLKDKFGLSWQIVPRQISEFLNHPDAEKGSRVMAAVMQMKKIDLATLERAAA